MPGQGEGRASRLSRCSNPTGDLKPGHDKNEAVRGSQSRGSDALEGWCISRVRAAEQAGESLRRLGHETMKVNFMVVPPL